MLVLIIIPFLIIMCFAGIRFWGRMTRNKDSEEHWQEDHFNKQIEALKRASKKNNGADNQPS